MNTSTVKEISVQELAQWRAKQDPVVLLDVREEWELKKAALPEVLHIPLGQLTQRASEIPQDNPLVVLCHHGVRSMQAALWLAEQGRSPVYNLAGGMDAWSREVDTTILRY